MVRTKYTSYFLCIKILCILNVSTKLDISNMSDNKFHIRNIIEFAKLYDEDKEARVKSIESLISLLETINTNRDKILIDGYYKTKVGNYEGRISFRAEWGGKVLILTKVRCVIPDGENKPKI